MVIRPGRKATGSMLHFTCSLTQAGLRVGLAR